MPNNTYVCDFLNYLLEETNVNMICECTISDIRKYLIHVRDNSRKQIDGDAWDKKRRVVLSFLTTYYQFNKDYLQFRYDGSKLFQETIMIDERTHRRKRIKVIAPLAIRRPRNKLYGKNRYLPYPYLQLILMEAEKNDPELVLPIALQAYAGLREGEVVNLTCGSYKEELGGFNSKLVSRIKLDLTHKAAFFTTWNKTTNPGEIKKYRLQYVYDDEEFIDNVHEYHLNHIYYMQAKGYSVKPEDPLLRNKHGHPMTVQTYSNRVKSLFEHFFLAALKRLNQEDTNFMHVAYLEAYSREYPGAHMFRHWFTMYLLTRAKLRTAEISKWRGDSSEEAMIAYIHENNEFIKEYEETITTMQLNILDLIR